MLSWVAGARAVTLDDYRHQVSRAHASIQELQAAYAAEYPSQREQFAASTIALVRAELPEQETVLLGRQTVAVDNTWLHKALDQLEKIKGDNARRADLLAHIDERLRALGERLEPDQTSADLLAQAESLARLGDLRAAIRKAYIALLCELGDRKVISLAQHKTNRDYLGAVRDRPSLFRSMRGLTNSFEIHWYGFVPPREDDWKEFRNGYQQALKTPNLS